MVRLSAIASLLLCLVPSDATSASASNQAEVNGVILPYTEEGAGETIIFVHGGLSGPGVWDPIRATTSKTYRSISYTQRYFGTAPWTDDGRKFGVETHANDLAAFITTLGDGPVHLVGWSYGGAVAATVALKQPSLVRSLIVYEPTLPAVLPPDSPDGKAAREERSRMFAAARAAAQAGDSAQAARLSYEAIYQMPPGSFASLPQATQDAVLENARTRPLNLAAPPSTVSCDDLKTVTQPTLVMWGEATQAGFAATSKKVAECVQGSQQLVMRNVNHDGPARDPDAFSAAVLSFLQKPRGM
jgi:pimeloyl-ACP methyl ester carboxylesterase